MKLGEYFSKKEKKALLLPEGIIVGTVIRAFVHFTNPPKEKRFIVVGFHEDKINLSSVLINSEINLNVNYTQELAYEHLFFKQIEREYLSHDSYIDCSEIHSIDISDINKKIDENPSIIIGQVSKSDLDRIMKQIIDSEVVKGKIKRRCGIFDYKFKNEQN